MGATPIVGVRTPDPLFLIQHDCLTGSFEINGTPMNQTRPCLDGDVKIELLKAAFSSGLKDRSFFAVWDITDPKARTERIFSFEGVATFQASDGRFVRVTGIPAEKLPEGERFTYRFGTIDFSEVQMQEVDLAKGEI